MASQLVAPASVDPSPPLTTSQLAGRAFYITSTKAGLNGYYRVVFTSERHNLMALYKIAAETADDGSAAAAWTVSAVMPFRILLSVFQALSAKECIEVNIRLPRTAERSVGTINGNNEDKKPERLPSSAKGKAKETRKQRYDRFVKAIESVASAEELERAVLYESFDVVAQDWAEKLKVSRPMMLRYIARYCICGCDPVKAAMTLLFGWDRTPETRVVEKKLGRRRDIVNAKLRPDANGRNSNSTDLAAVEAYESSLTQAQRKQSISKRHDNFITDAAQPRAQTLANGEVVFSPNPLEDLTYDQYKYLLKKIASDKERLAQKVGKIRFTKDHRILTGTARDYVPYPGYCYIIDATVADIYVVSAVNRKRLLGRPTLYFVVDAFSSVIVSVHVALGPACMQEAQIALYRAMTPKNDLIRHLGLPEELLAFLPQGCVPRAVFADRGEILSERARNLAEELRLQLLIAPPYRPDLKGLVERYFRFVNDAAIAWIPGAVVEKHRERGQEDPRLDAVMTLNGLLRVLLVLVAENNGFKDMGKHMSVSMIRSEIDATPIGFWSYGLSVLHGSPHFLSKADAVKQLLPTMEARCNRLGLQWEQLRYTAEWMRDDDSFFYQSSTGGAKMYQDPDRPLSALYLDPETSELRHVDLVQDRGYEEMDVDMSFVDVVDNEARTKLDGKAFAMDSEIAKRTMKRLRSGIVRDEAEATRQANEGDDTPKSQKTKGIKDNRRAAERAALGYSAAQTVVPPPPTNANEPERLYSASLSSIFGV